MVCCRLFAAQIVGLQASFSRYDIRFAYWPLSLVTVEIRCSDLYARRT